MPDTVIIDSLLHVMRTLRRHYDDCARGMGLTMSRARVITTLGRQEGLSQRELAAILEIEAPTLKRQLDGLEADGFIERRPIAGDARKNAVFLTPKGRDSEINAFSRKLRSDVVEGICVDDLRCAHDVLEQIAANITRMTER